MGARDSCLSTTMEKPRPMPTPGDVVQFSDVCGVSMVQSTIRNSAPVGPYDTREMTVMSLPKFEPLIISHCKSMRETR